VSGLINTTGAGKRIKTGRAANIFGRTTYEPTLDPFKIQTESAMPNTLPKSLINIYACCLVIVAFATPIKPAIAQDADVPSIRAVADIHYLPSKIAFGSCSNQNKPQPILDTVVTQKPDLFIYLGDNIYGDTKDMDILAQKYQKLGSKQEFQKLRANTTVLSTWDDHDYGWNDAGKEYQFKEASKEIFMNFWSVPNDSSRRKRAGIYGSHTFSDGKNTLQVILLDTRTFRDPLKRNSETNNLDGKFKNAYQPDATKKTILGDAQWKWLENEFKQNADLRIICSSIQFGHEYNGWESWTNLPNEQKKMAELIKKTQANGVVFISGDVHWAEISKRNFQGLYPIYDVTASGITEDWHNLEPNRYRVKQAFRENHFGMIEIDWKKDKPDVNMQILNVAGKPVIRHSVPLNKLRFNQKRPLQ
jgi:alkaline phosphatase D